MNEQKLSFSKQIKEELLNKAITDDEIAISFLAGIISSIGKIEISKENVSVNCITDVAGLYDYTNKILKMLYGDYATLEIVEKSIINKTLYYNIEFPQDKTIQILKDTELIELTPQGYKTKTIDGHILNSHEKQIAFITAVFLTTSTNSIKISENPNEKTASGYHLEFTSHNKEFLTDFNNLLASHGIFARLIERKKLFVIYLKDAQSISDLLALMGASEAVLTLQNEIVTREIRNAVNRQVNCMSANISKTVGANMKQLEAIEIISSTIGLDSLSEELQEVALLRLANTEESLQDLVKLSSLPLTKSGINHRMRKILKIAEELKE